MHLFFGPDLSSPYNCLPFGEGSDHSFINTSLRRRAYGVARQQTALAVSPAQ